MSDRHSNSECENILSADEIENNLILSTKEIEELVANEKSQILRAPVGFK